MFKLLFRRGPRLQFRRHFSVLNQAHDKTFNFLIRPVFFGIGATTALYFVARYQKIRMLHYEDPFYPPGCLAPTTRDLPEWQRNGLGEFEYYSGEKGCVFSADFAIDTPPVLTKHTNAMAMCLKENPSLWAPVVNPEVLPNGNTKDNETTRTAFGNTLMKCIKPGVDNPGCEVGLIMCDEACYSTFTDFYDAVLARVHNFSSSSTHSTDMDCSKLIDATIDPTGQYLVSTKVEVTRNVADYFFTPSIDFYERRRLEKSFISVFGGMDGEYFPLYQNRSWKAKPYGMSEQDQAQLSRTAGFFDTPACTEVLSSGAGRCWPDARGIFTNSENNLFVQVNKNDHLNFIAVGKSLQDTASRALGLSKDFEAEYNGTYAKDDKLGYLTTCVGNLGTGLKASVMLNIPKVSSQTNFSDTVSSMGLKAECRGNGMYEISNAGRLGTTEVASINGVVEGASKLVQMEMSS